MRLLCLLLLLMLAVPAAAEPTSAAALIAQGRADAAAGLPLLALADWAKAASLDPANPDIYDARASFYAAQKQWERAEPDAARAALLSPTLARCNLHGDVLVRLSRHSDAARAYSHALSLSLDTNKTAADYVADGVKWEAQGQAEKADAAYAQASVLDSKNSDALRRSLALHAQWGDAEGALSCASSLVALDPKDPQGYADRAALLATLGRWDGAIADGNAAILYAPQDPSAWLARGVLYSQYAQTLVGNAAKPAQAKAVDDFARALLLDPNNVKALAARGVAYYAQGDYDKALPDLNRAIDLGAGFSVAFLFRANIYALRHQDTLALDDFNKALLLDPSDARATAGRADTLKRLGRAQ